MSLQDVLKKKSPVIVGINSGTSADGADLAALKISETSKSSKISFLASRKQKYPPSLKALIIKTAAADRVAPEELIYLDNILGRFYGRAADAFIKKLKKKKIYVDAVASHGQTVRHLPRKVRYEGFNVRGTLQLGSLEQIAARTGKITVGDFRQADIALDREGAPITTAAVEKLLAHPRESRLLVNIGGIANYFYFPAKTGSQKALAADCGPGNSVVDLLVFRLFKEKYDKNGHRAQKGKISQRLLALLLSHPFFKQNRRSTGREEFGFEMADKIVDFGRKLNLHGNDLIATAAEFTVLAVIKKIEPILQTDRNILKLYLTGGGERNTFFKTRLALYLPDIRIESVRRLGFSPETVEAASYAVMGLACLRGERLRTDFMNKTSRKTQPVLGKIVQPPGRL